MIEQVVEKNVVHAMYHLAMRRWNIILLMMVIAVVGAFNQHHFFPRYLAVSKLIVRSQGESPLLMALGKVANFNGAAEGAFAPLSQRYVKMLESGEFLEYSLVALKKQLVGEVSGPVKVVAAYYNLRLSEESNAELARVIFAALSIKSRDEIIEFYIRSPSPEVSASMATIAARLGYNFLTEYDLKEISDTQTYLALMAEKNDARIRDLSEKLDSLTIQTGTTIYQNGTASESTAVQMIRKTKDEISDTEVKLSENKVLIRRIFASIRADIGAGRPVDARINTEVRSPASTNEGTDDYLRGRGNLVDRIKLLKSTREIMEAKLQALKEQLQSTIDNARPKVEQNIYELSKKLEIENGLSRDLNKQIVETQMYQITVENRLRPYESASATSVVPDSSLSKKMMIACILAIFITGFGIYLWEQFNPLLSDRTDFTSVGIRFLGGIPDLFVPKFFSFRSKSGLSVEETLKKIYRLNVRSHEVLSFQFLATRLTSRIAKVTKRNGGILGIVSMHSKEGKTLICSNLSVAFGLQGTRVLYIDGDYLNFRDHPMFETNSKLGLFELLKGDVDIGRVVQKTQFKNVDFMPSGKNTKSLELFSETVLKDVLDRLKSQYDFIVFDTPAYRAGPESIIFNSFADLTVIVGTPYETRMDELKELNDALENKGQANIVGVLNHFATPTFKSDYYYMDSSPPKPETGAA